MWDDFIGRQIQRTNRNLLVLGSVILAILGTILAATWRNVYNFVYGPFPTNNSELERIGSPDQPQRYFLMVQGESLFSTGMREVANNNHSKVLAEVVALRVGDHLLLVKAPAGRHELQYTGTLAAIPAEVTRGMSQNAPKTPPGMNSPVLPFMLDATGFRTFDNWMAALGAVVLTAIGLGLAGLALRRMAQPEAHPLLSKLAQYGSFEDVRMRIDSELRSENGGEKFGALRITTNWLIHAAAYKTGVMASPDIVWAYPKVTKHYHGAIPTGKTYSAILRDSKGQSMEVSGKKDSVPKLMESLQKRMPWILIGFNKELEALWRTEKQKFFELMDERRAELSPAAR